MWKSSRPLVPNTRVLPRNADSAAIWLQPPSVARLHSFDMAVEPYSQSSQAFVHALFPGRLTFHRGDTMATLPKHAALVEAGRERPCDLWFVDGGHSGRVPYSDLEHAWRSAHDGTVIVADDCTGRFQDVRNAWHRMLSEGKIVPLNGTRMHDGGSGRLTQHAPSPGQPVPSARVRPYMYIVGIKGWCSGVVAKPPRNGTVS